MNFSKYRYLYAILAVAALLRCWQLGWGFPQIYEEATPMKAALRLWDAPDMNPHFFNYPALTIYLQFGIQKAVYAAGHAAGLFPDAHSFTGSAAAVGLSGRIMSVLFDLGTIVVLWLLVRRIAGELPALIAAGIAAINPFAVQEAHFIQVDTPLVFFSLLALYYMTEERVTVKSHLLAGAAIGLAAASKYTGAFLLPAFVLAQMARERSMSSALKTLQEPKLYATIAASAVVFLLWNPYVAASYPEFRDGFGFEQQHIALGHLGVNPGQSSIAYYLLGALPGMLGWALFAAGIGGVIYAAVRRDRRWYPLLAFVVVYLAIVSTWEMRVERYVFPLVPPFIAFAALGITALGERLKGSPGGSPLLRNGAVAALIVAAGLEPAIASYRYLAPLGLPDTRALAESWISEHLPAGSVVATGPYGVELPPDKYVTLEIPFLGFETERVAPFYDTRWYEDVDLLIASNYDRERYAAEPQRYHDFLSYYDSLAGRWKLALELTPSSGRTGPAFWLYRYPDSLRKNAFDSTLFTRLEASPESARVSNFLKDLNAVCIRKGKWEKSEQLLREILSVEDKNVPLRNLLAQVLVNEGKFDAALRQLQLSLQQRPDQPEVFALAGHALLQLKHEREAEPALQRALSLNRDLPTAYEDLITLYDARRDWKLLAQTLRRYKAILPAGTPRADEVKKQLETLAGRE